MQWNREQIRELIRRAQDRCVDINKSFNGQIFYAIARISVAPNVCKKKNDAIKIKIRISFGLLAHRTCGLPFI